MQTFQNALLKNLDREIIERLSLRPVKLERLHELEFPGNAIEHLFFVEEGMASMTATFNDGSQVEVCMFGYESVIGVSALMGTKRSLNRIYMQIEGSGFSCTVEAARKEFLRCATFQGLMLRYVQAQLLQATQTAGCNAKHNIEQRLARWLLLCMDRVHTDTLKLSHEFLADMLGSSRPTVSIAAGSFKEQGLIEYNRALIRILDVKQLEKKACDCYLVIKNYLNNFAEFDTDFAS